LFAPDEDFAVVGGGSEYCAEFRMGPGDTPDGAFVAVKGERLELVPDVFVW